MSDDIKSHPGRAGKAMLRSGARGRDTGRFCESAVGLSSPKSGPVPDFPAIGRLRATTKAQRLAVPFAAQFPQSENAEMKESK